MQGTPLFMVQSYSTWFKALDPTHTAWSDLCNCALVIMDGDAFTIKRKMSWKNSFHLRKVKRQNILLHCPKTFLSYLTHIYLFSFLLVFISLFPKALCWKTSPKKLVTLLSNQWWWKYFVSLGIKINLIALWISFYCANKFIY